MPAVQIQPTSFAIKHVQQLSIKHPSAISITTDDISLVVLMNGEYFTYLLLYQIYVEECELDLKKRIFIFNYLHLITSLFFFCS